MAQGKPKKSSQWFQCDKCQAYIINKHLETHEEFCPPHLEDFQYPFVLDQVLYGFLDLKQSEDIKNLSTREKDGMVFISQATMQLCCFAIGEFVMLQQVGQQGAPLIRKVWPTCEKSLISVLVTKGGLENSNFEANDKLTVSNFDKKTALEASEVSLVILNGPKSMEISTELSNRLSKTYSGRYITNNSIIHVVFYGSRLKFEDLSIGDKIKVYLASSNTKWKIFGSQVSFTQATVTEAHYQVAGLDEERIEILEMINATFKTPQTNAFMQNKSVLVYGNTGTGKTTLAKMIAQNLRVNVVEIFAPQLYSKNSGNPEEVINELFKNAIENSPSLIILDEIDILCPSRTGRINESEKRIVATILTRLDELSQASTKVFIIATANKIDNIEPALRRCGRLDREIEIPTPNPRARRLIIAKILSAIPHNLSEADLQEIAITTHGYVGADLVSLCSQANLLSSRRSAEEIELVDLKAALRKVRPSAMREVQIEVPNVKWSDIGGHEKMKALLSQCVEWPLKYPESFVRLGISPPKGVLMFGPPGCSKTMIAKALATESGLNFISIKGSELFSKWVGESEKAIRDVFRKARQVAPSVVFFDEIDAIAGERSSEASTSVQERVLAQLLTELDGITPLADVNILAATNRPDRIDKALIRPGRIDRAVYVTLPDDDVRRDIFRIQFLKMPTQDVRVEELVERTRGYSGAEITGICKEAAMFALKEDLQTKFVRMAHFEMALSLAPPRTPADLLRTYENFVIGRK